MKKCQISYLWFPCLRSNQLSAWSWRLTVHRHLFPPHPFIFWRAKIEESWNWVRGCLLPTAIHVTYHFTHAHTHTPLSSQSAYCSVATTDAHAWTWGGNRNLIAPPRSPRLDPGDRLCLNIYTQTYTSQKIYTHFQVSMQTIETDNSYMAMPARFICLFWYSSLPRMESSTNEMRSKEDKCVKMMTHSQI